MPQDTGGRLCLLIIHSLILFSFGAHYSLKYNPAEDRVLVPLVQAGVDFLLSGEQAGCWVTHNASLHSKRSASGVIYDRYHSSYCAAIGLVDYGFMRGPTLEFPQPRIFQLVLSSQ